MSLLRKSDPIYIVKEMAPHRRFELRRRYVRAPFAKLRAYRVASLWRRSSVYLRPTVFVDKLR